MIGVIVAMGSEFRLVEALLADRREENFRGFRFVLGKVGGKEVVLMQSGIGKVCGAAGTVELIDRYAPDCILNTGVAGGIDKSLREDLAAIKQRFPEGLAVDMESGAIAQVCHIYGVPFLSCRIISDTPGVEDHFMQYLDFWTLAPEKSVEALRQVIARL